MFGSAHCALYHFPIITSDLAETPVSEPPFTLILPPTIEARALLNALGREVMAVRIQAVAPGRRVITSEWR